ncbi:MAG: 16S rRNA (guanine(527)-N(7))-methyltransferase RsmG [Candidatus Dormibacteria bacterium]
MPGAALVQPSAEQRRRLSRYLDELTRWSSGLNLTSVTRTQADSRHLSDVIELLTVAPPAMGALCVDIGSGGGVPGIPLAILRPDLRVTLLEKDRRKCGFLIHVAGLLELAGVEVLTARAEDTGHDPGRRELYDIAVSRAAAPAPVLCELGLPLLRRGGVLLAIMRDPAGAAGSAAAAAAACGGAAPEPLSAGILRVRKALSTAADLPRRAGTPQRRPLGGTTLRG